MNKNYTLKTLLFSFRKFPVTLPCIWLFTILLIANIHVPFILYQQFISEILTFLFCFGTISFFIDALFLRRQRSKWYFFTLFLGILLSLLFVWLEIRASFIPYFDFFQYYICYFLFFFSLGVYFCSQNLSCSFEEYLVKVFDRTLHYHIVWFLLSLGFNIITPIALQLFHLDSFLMLQILLLLFGLYYMSSFLLSWYPEETNENVITSFLIKYMLPGILIVVFVIIYIYITKILIIGNIPPNVLLRNTAVLFLFGMPICFMNAHYHENNPFRRITKWLPCLFLPFIPLQIYSIGIRIYENGITPLRYGAIFFIFFECIALFLYYFRKICIKQLPLLAAILIAFCCFFPFVNMKYVSYFSQRTAIEQFLSLPEEEQDDIVNHDYYSRYYGAYHYLRSDQLGNKYLSSLTQEEMDALSSFDRRK
ncbi:MAG: DUF4153 domain-containing protein [Lachnospiraceae bacterium]|nr:DUF4153 domain-containing protein [Lachnospiraceae bacterium]